MRILVLFGFIIFVIRVVFQSFVGYGTMTSMTADALQFGAYFLCGLGFVIYVAIRLALRRPGTSDPE